MKPKVTWRLIPRFARMRCLMLGWCVGIRDERYLFGNGLRVVTRTYVARNILSRLLYSSRESGPKRTAVNYTVGTSDNATAALTVAYTCHLADLAGWYNRDLSNRSETLG